MIGLFLTVLSAGVLSDSQTVNSTGSISAVNVGVYSDSYCTTNCTSIAWRNIAPGASVTKTVYIKNTGSVAVTLTMATSGWAPSNANNYLTQVWDRSGYTLGAGASISATLILSAQSNTGSLTTFSYNIVITGTH